MDELDLTMSWNRIIKHHNFPWRSTHSSWASKNMEVFMALDGFMTPHSRKIARKEETPATFLRNSVYCALYMAEFPSFNAGRFLCFGCLVQISDMICPIVFECLIL
ncbi:hypothetical protein Droror1_Dr00016708 [Drosera rotundifolia]